MQVSNAGKNTCLGGLCDSLLFQTLSCLGPVAADMLSLGSNFYPVSASFTIWLPLTLAGCFWSFASYDLSSLVRTVAGASSSVARYTQDTQYHLNFRYLGHIYTEKLFVFI